MAELNTLTFSRKGNIRNGQQINRLPRRAGEMGHKPGPRTRGCVATQAGPRVGRGSRAPAHAVCPTGVCPVGQKAAATGAGVAEAPTGERERLRWLWGVEYPDWSKSWSSGWGGGAAQSPYAGVWIPAVLKCASNLPRRERPWPAKPAERARRAPGCSTWDSRGVGPKCTASAAAVAVWGCTDGTADGAGCPAAEADGCTGGAAAVPEPGGLPGGPCGPPVDTGAAACGVAATACANSASAIALKAVGSPICQPSRLATSVQTAKAAPTC